jgi:hypothetical protein
VSISGGELRSPPRKKNVLRFVSAAPDTPCASMAVAISVVNIFSSSTGFPKSLWMAVATSDVSVSTAVWNFADPSTTVRVMSLT